MLRRTVRAVPSLLASLAVLLPLTGTPLVLASQASTSTATNSIWQWTGTWMYNETAPGAYGTSC
jgi:hypothetical protein